MPRINPRYAFYALLAIVAIVAGIISLLQISEIYNEYTSMIIDFNSALGELRADISHNNQVLSERNADIDDLQTRNTELERELDVLQSQNTELGGELERSRNDIDELERIERERTELQERLESLEEYRGKEDSLFAGLSLNECHEIVIYLFNSYREFITENESQYPDLLAEDKIFLFPDFYPSGDDPTGDDPAGDDKNSARRDYADTIFTVDENDHLLDLPYNPKRKLVQLLLQISVHRIINITEDKTNIPANVDFENIFDPEIYDCIHFSEEEYDTIGIFPSIDDPDVLFTASECFSQLPMGQRRCIV